MNSKNNLQIRFLKIKNYRQYYGEQKIDLSSYESDANINIIQGENGEGKSNILNAINYCLYLKEPHLKNSPVLPIINLRAMRDGPIGSIVDMEIELELGNEDTRYRIRRAVHVKRVEPREDKSEQNIYAVENGHLGTFPVDSRPWDEFEIKSVESGGWEDVVDRESFIQEVLPKGLSSFFFLDGEFLESLHGRFEKIKDGVEEISQLKLVLSAISHMINMMKYFEGKTRGLDPNVDKYQRQVNQIEELLHSVDGTRNMRYSNDHNDVKWWMEKSDSGEWEYHPSSGRPRLISKKKEAEVLKNRIAEIDRELTVHNSNNVREWSHNLAHLEKTIEKEESLLDEKNKESWNLIAAIGPEVYLDSCIQNFIRLVEEKRSRGELPVKWTEIFVDDLLSHNRCICGNDLTEGGASRKALLEWREKSRLSEQLDAVVEATADFKLYKKTLKDKFRDLDRLRREMDDIKKDLEVNRLKCKDFKQKLKDTDENKIQGLINEKEARQRCLEKIQREIGALESDVKSYEDRLNAANTQLRGAESRTKQLEQKRAMVSLCRRTLTHLMAIRDNVLTRMRTAVASSTRDNFFDLIWKKNEFSDVGLTDDYRLTVIKGGYNAVNALSAGEKLVLALSFIVSIRSITEFNMPLIIDTPLAKIAGKTTKNIADFMKDFSRNMQVTLLVTDKEYQFVDQEIGRSFRDLIKDSVNKEYILNRRSQEDTTVRVMQ